MSRWSKRRSSGWTPAAGLALAVACGLGPLPAAAGEPSAGGGSGAPAGDPWQVPAEGACAPEGGLRGWPLGEDAPAIPFQPGEVLDLEASRLLRSYLPREVFEHREIFFYEGMRLEIGPCFRSYAPPAFFEAATQAHRGAARLLENGGLEGYVAGLPFAPDTIDAGDPQAGLKWAWNVAHRYAAGGFRGKFRVSDIVGRTGRAEPFEGEIFKLQLAFRADRPDDGYTAPGGRGMHWVAGGQLTLPFDAREHAWRQFRAVEHLASRRRSDDLYVYIPTRRRVRRTSAADVEGIYMPSFNVGVSDTGQLAVGGGGETGGVGSVGSGAAGAATLTTKRSGFEGLELRPLLYAFRVRGVQDVLAPLNAASPSYPAARDRDFGPWGLSFASDRWDLRRALVLEASSHEAMGDAQLTRVVHYVDLETLQPLYYVSYDKDGELIDVGLFVGRFSEDRPDYPRWPDDPERPVRVIDPAGAAFANLRETGGWRRESWELVSVPPEDRAVKRMLSVQNLTKRR